MIDEAIYERQNRLTGIDIPEIVSVVGCGGTGFWTALFLAMSGVKELILVDPDKLETSNLNRLPLKESTVGMQKAEVVSNFIKTIRGPVRIEEHCRSIYGAEDCAILRGAVFCCTDNLKSQQIICAYCKKNNIPYQRIGYDGTILNVSKAFPLSFEEATDQGGYSVTPSWVVPAVLAAAAGVSSKLYKEVCIMDDIGKLHTQGCSHICPKLLDDARDKGREEGVEDGEQGILDNIHDHIPDGYGYCEDCDMRYTESEVDEIRDEARAEGVEQGQEDGYTDGVNGVIDQIQSGNVKDSALEEALEAWKENQIEEENENELSLTNEQ